MNFLKSDKDKLLINTVRIESYSDASNSSVGTGFIVECQNKCHYIVTNKHVIGDHKFGNITFTLCKNETADIGNTINYEIQNLKNRWFGHPIEDVDIAIMPMGPVKDELKLKHDCDLCYSMIPLSLIPNEDQLSKFSAIEEVFFIGYPNGIYDTVNYLPIIRRGTTASPINIDFEGEKKFIIDASVFGGSSGSPVVICRDFSSEEGNLLLGKQFFFLGVLTSSYFRNETGTITDELNPLNPKATITSIKQMVDLGTVLKASLVVQCIDQLWASIVFMNEDTLKGLFPNWPDNTPIPFNNLQEYMHNKQSV